MPISSAAAHLGQGKQKRGPAETLPWLFSHIGPGYAHRVRPRVQPNHRVENGGAPRERTYRRRSGMDRVRTSRVVAVTLSALFASGCGDGILSGAGPAD